MSRSDTNVSFVRSMWAAQLCLLTASTLAMVGSGCGKSAPGIRIDGAASPDDAAATSGLAGSGGSTGSQGLTGAAGSTAVGGGSAAAGKTEAAASGGGGNIKGAGGTASGGSAGSKTANPGGSGGSAAAGIGGSKDSAGPGGTTAAGGSSGLAAGGSVGAGGTVAKGGTNGAAGISGTGGSAGRSTGGSSCLNSSAAGGHAISGKVGDLVPNIETLSVDANRDDGFVKPNRSDVWTVDVASRATTLNTGSPVTATATQIQALVSALAASTYGFNSLCCGSKIYIDGAPFAPKIKTSGGGTTHEFGVSAGICAGSSRSTSGDVLNCTDYKAIYTLLESIAPSGVAFSCSSFW